MKRRTFISGVLGLGSSALATCMLVEPPLPGTSTRHAMHGADAVYTGADLAFGTTISIQVLHNDQRQAELAIEDAIAAAKKIDRLMTLRRADSQVAVLNRAGRLASPDPHLVTVLKHAAHLSGMTDGAFDITVQPLWNAYASSASSGALPTAQARREAMALIDWRGVILDSHAVELSRPGMAITLNGVAQGYAVDLARDALTARGIRHAFLDTGEFGSYGRNLAQRDWSVGVRDPRDTQRLARVLSLRGRCVATSGDYESFFTPDLAHHHILNPASGNSPMELSSVTVCAPTGLEADGLSTAMMVLGTSRAIRLASTLRNVDVLLIDKNGEQWQTPGLV